MSRLPRTLQLVHTMNIGGAETLAAKFARKLGGPENVVIACLDDAGEMASSLVAEGFRVEPLDRAPGPFDRACLKRLASLIARERIELIHAHQYTPFQIAALARGWKRKPPILFTEHGRFFPDRRNWKWLLINSRLLAPKDRIAAVGESVKQALICNEGLPAHRIDVVYNGIDLERADALMPDRDVVRAELGLSAQSFAVLMAARLDPIKDHQTALTAFARLKQSTPNASLFLAGAGSEYHAIEQRIEELALDGVYLLGSRSDVPRLLAGMDAVLLTSLSEGIPLSLIEAMAAFLPVVATHVGGIPEVVVNSQTGLLNKVGDAAGLAESLERLATDGALREQLGNHGRQRAEQLFSESRMLERYSAIYREMTA